ncbi:hypothetical protein HNR06_005056 [Nocardiopsis arvandica]|uniref:Uncharacterized protein n=1 Tax=Nocardiopsis sinuspersici TaxID=501010 RepID=A0A7Y9XIS7_9ACTN|nr:hypothetical protein [Nocardiopsis sinuspersici]
MLSKSAGMEASDRAVYAVTGLTGKAGETIAALVRQAVS